MSSSNSGNNNKSGGGHLESWMSPETWSNTWQPLPLHPSPRKEFKLNIANYAVTSKDIAEFKERGVWISPKVIDDATIKLLNDETQRVFQGEVDYPSAPYEYQQWITSVRNHKQNDPAIRKVHNAWYVNHVYRTLSTNAAIGGMAAQLLSTEEVRLWHDEAVWKPADGKSSNIPAGKIGWHQDYSFWQISNTTNMASAWIPLQDITIENGGMRTIVGSHKWGLVQDAATFYDKDTNQLKERFDSLGTWTDEPCIVKAGHVIFQHALTFHGSGPNLSSEPRLAIGLHMMPKGCGYSGKGGYHHNLKDIGPNAVTGTYFEGDHFPLVYRKRRPSNFDYP